MYIGKNMRELRESKKMSLTELSEQSGVQLATLSRMENNKMTGTLESHLKIAQALGVELGQLYKDISREKIKKDVRTRPSISEVFVHNEKASYEILTQKAMIKKMMPVLLKIEPGGKTNIEENPAGTEKFIYVLEGRVEVHVGPEKIPLSAKHSLYIDASLRHYFENAGKTTVKLISVASPVVM